MRNAVFCEYGEYSSVSLHFDDVAIIGAGPYGLSIAAHLRKRNIAFRIFGTPMASWRFHMAKGTFLKSDGFASNLYDPDATFTLADYCREYGVPYANVGNPVPIETFAAYGLQFQERFVPELEQTDITSVRKIPEGFELSTQGGETLRARRVIVAAGITHFSYVPPLFAHLSEDRLTHSSQHKDVSSFRNRTVAVLGAGASAIDLAGLLHEAGAEVQLIARRDAVAFHDPPIEPRALRQRILNPRSGLGLGWRSRLCTDVPLVFHALPLKLRMRAVQRHLGPAPGWFAKSKVVDKVTMHLGTRMQEVTETQGGVRLRFKDIDAADRELYVDHVIAATGYKVKLSRVHFLEEGLRQQLSGVEDTPVLSRNFESTVPGLYMVGLASSNSFGPLTRFAYGANFTAKRLARHLAAVV